MARIVAFSKYQEGDFQPDPTLSWMQHYSGPEYKIHFPSGCDPIQKMFAWSNLGYQIGPSFGIIDSSHESHTLVVYGDIPDFFKERLEAAGVRVVLTHARGERVIEM